MNYQMELENIIKEIKEEQITPRLLLHSCCAPCSTYVLEYLAEFFSITVFYYNPNIDSKEEYNRRSMEQQYLIEQMQTTNPIIFLEGPFEPTKFFNKIKGTEHVKEGGERCMRCFELRLEESAKIAKDEGFDYFTTTLTISPLKNASALNTIGKEVGDKIGVKYLTSDFKKKNGYKRSVELSKDYNLYRQDYCGCIFSKKERELDKSDNAVIN